MPKVLAGTGDRDDDQTGFAAGGGGRGGGCAGDCGRPFVYSGCDVSGIPGLAGWLAVGQAEWKAENGEIVGEADGGERGLAGRLDRSYQDVGVCLEYTLRGGVP